MADNDYYEEEAFVLAEITGVIDSEVLSLDNKSCKILGLESDEPILQIEGFFFAGKHDESVGTSVFFDSKLKDVTTHAVAPQGAEKQLELLCHTTKKIAFKRAFLKEKDDAPPTITK